jgi:chitodextrinase
MKRLISIALLVASTIAFAQNGNSLWKTNTVTGKARMSGSKNLPQKKLYDLNITALQNILNASPKRFANGISSTIITLPNAEGTFENFRVYENPVMDEALAAKYPEIKSYMAVGVENASARVYFSFTPLGFKSMALNPGKPAVFIEPLTTDLTTYTVYRKSDYLNGLDPIECKIIDEALTITSADMLARPNADDAKLRTFRLALSCTGEYATYFGGTKALALAGMNNTLTRCNGIFESDFGLRLVLIASNDNVIYTSAATDPYADAASMSSWNSQLQSTLTAVIGESNYDIGHLFGATGGGGNAGCIGCVCVNGSKGSGYTSPSSGIPAGDNFDIDYVAHEMGHQLGANHTYTHVTESGTGAQMEPGSGSTIMSYAGITTKDIQRHSDPYFHAISIQQVTNNIKAKTCPTLTATGNSIPVVNAGLDYTIPKGTPFMLTGTASDANGDVLTYTWEEMDLGTATTATPIATATSGPIFRSYAPTTSPTRYFPRMATVLSGLTITAGTEIPWEVLPTVARTLNFRMTVRDNRAGGPANNSDDVIVTVNGVAGPFTVSSPNTAVTYTGGSIQTITWNVAGTTGNGVNCANVDILLSTDGGQTFPITLKTSTANDGSESIVIPNIAGSSNRIMIKGNNHVFFDVSDTNFSISNGTALTDIIAPIVSTLNASGTTVSSTNLSWSASDNVGVVGYDVYQNGVYKASTTSTTLAVTSLSTLTAYSFYILAKDAAGNVSAASNIVNIITLSLSLDLLAPTAPTLTASGTTTSTTNLTWSAATDNIGVTGYNIYQNGILKATTTALSYAVFGLTASTAYNFYVTAKDAAGNVSAASNTVNVITLSLSDILKPTTPTLAASGVTTSTTSLTWSAASDNVGVTGYNIYQNGILKATTTALSYAVSGLTASTAYNFYITAKDAAGNVSVASNTANVTTMGNVAAYCTSSGNSAREYINQVQIGSINNLSGNNGGYGNFASLSTSLALGSSNAVSITPFRISTAYAEAYRIWIDFNHDGDFTDSGELVLNLGKTKSSIITGNISIPTTALPGTTRMRVTMKYNALSTACESFTYGEVEDYTVSITASGRIEEENAAKLSFVLYPNPVSGETLNISNLENPGTFRIFNMLGQQLMNDKIENEAVYVGSLKAGHYLIEVSDGVSKATKQFIKQ